MAQTTTQVPLSCGKVEISSNCSDYDDISGETISVQDTAQTAMSGETYTMTGDVALISGGKREPIVLTVNIVYTETDAEAYQTAREIFEVTGCNRRICVRLTPRGAGAGHEQLTGDGQLIEFQYPTLDASSAGPIPGYFKVKIPEFTTTIIAS